MISCYSLFCGLEKERRQRVMMAMERKATVAMVGLRCKRKTYGRPWLRVAFTCAFFALAAFFVVAAVVAYLEYTAPLTAAEEMLASLLLNPRSTGRWPILTASFLALASAVLGCRSACLERIEGGERPVGKLVNEKRAFAIPRTVALGVSAVAAIAIMALCDTFAPESSLGLIAIGMILMLFLVSLSRIFELDNLDAGKESEEE